MNKKYPFPFLDAYRKEDREFFFGRDEEIEALYRMTLQSNIVLVYGTSGTGKTSLIRCGLANEFKSYDWLELYVRRGNNIVASLDEILCKKSDAAFTYSETPAPVLQNLAQKIEAVYKASFKPIYLIFDQFEELYTISSKDKGKDKDEQTKFIQAIKELLLVEQPVKIIFSIREEYLGHLYEFEKQVPGLLRKKLRVEPMNLGKVTEVIKKVGAQKESVVQLKAGEEEKIAERIFEKIKGEKNTLTIELPYLQVFLDKLYLQITGDETRKQEALFTIEALDKMGDIGDVLRNFLDEQVLLTARKLDQKSEIIWQILSPFVTLDGTKEPLSSENLYLRLPGLSHSLIDTTLKAFGDSRILRFTEYDQRYEVAHDSLAKQIAAKRSDEEIAKLEVLRLVKSQTALKAEAREFFTEKQLGFIGPFLEKLNLGDEEQDWIARSRAYMLAEKDAEEKRQREKLEEAQRQAEQERQLRGQAVQAQLKAEQQKARAEQAKEEAEIQRGIAQQNVHRAKQRGTLAVIAFFAALAFAIFGWNKAIEAKDNLKNLTDENEARIKAETINKQKDAEKLIQQAELDIEAEEFWFAQQKLDSASVLIPGDPRIKEIKKEITIKKKKRN